MNIMIEGTEGLPAGDYGSRSYVDAQKGVLHIVVDTEVHPAESSYPVTVGSNYVGI
jgi:hypothetical protein